MNITDIRIRTINNAGNLKASASITIDNEFAVHDIKVIETEDSRFIAMPSRKIPNTDRFADIAHPITQDVRSELQRMILAKYDEVLASPEAMEETPEA